jgi:hypothetical protein
MTGRIGSFARLTVDGAATVLLHISLEFTEEYDSCMTKLLVSLAFTVSLSSGQQFEAVSVKHYDHKNDRNTPWGARAVFGCHLGPGQLQYSCTGPVSRLAAEALNLQTFQYDEEQHAAE